MVDIEFGSIGVDVENYTPEGLHKLFIENGLDGFIRHTNFLDREAVYSKGKYLQAQCRGELTETTNLCVMTGYIRYTTNMETYMLILRTALLDADIANEILNDLHYEGLIKRRAIV